MQKSRPVVAVSQPKFSITGMVPGQFPRANVETAQPEMSERTHGMGRMPPVLRHPVELRQRSPALLVRPGEDVVQGLTERAESCADPLDVIVKHGGDIISKILNAEAATRVGAPGQRWEAAERVGMAARSPARHP
jgi:hypothetical protein